MNREREMTTSVQGPQGRGFTIVELLVVIAVIGILMGLLLPAIQAARESGRRTACMSNAYQLGMAVNRYDQDKGRVPGWVNLLGGGNVGWPVMCLPYLERNDIFDVWAGGGTPGGVIGLYKCPSALPATPNLAPIVYVGNCGNQGDATPDSNCGVMGNGAVVGTSISLEDVADRDGTATTLLFGEKALGGNFDLQKRWDYVPAGPLVYDLNVNNSFNDPNDPSWVIGYAGFGLPSAQQGLRSAHSRGSVVTFCDGHTYFLKDDVDVNTYIQLVTHAGGLVPDSGPNRDYSTNIVGILDESKY
jgi:prepilin-type N-terminal cleavage/methylation domain-containing protein/prepilin-type processing-associated H-X9-DG protein